MTSPSTARRKPDQSLDGAGPNPGAGLAAAEVLDRKTVVVAVTAALVLTLQHYGSSPAVLDQVLRGLGWLAYCTGLADAPGLLDNGTRTPLGGLTWWSLTCLLTYFVLPALVIRFILNERLGDYGIKWRGALSGLPVYLGMLALVLPLVVLVSADERFQRTYPFYPVSPGEGLGPRYWGWELLYAAQFFALEFFFRGFLVLGTRHRFGPNAVVFMMVPYCMLHFGKPMLEALAAIVAGMALGLMSYKTRSIWLGAVLHVSVAWSMDLAVLCRRGIDP